MESLTQSESLILDFEDAPTGRQSCAHRLEALELRALFELARNGPSTVAQLGTRLWWSGAARVAVERAGIASTSRPGSSPTPAMSSPTTAKATSVSSASRRSSSRTRPAWTS